PGGLDRSALVGRRPKDSTAESVDLTACGGHCRRETIVGRPAVDTNRCGNGPAPAVTGGAAVPRVMAVRGPNGSAPGIIEGQPWSTMPGSTSRWNGAACAWWM